MKKILIVILLAFVVLFGVSILLKNLSLRRITARLVSLNTAEIKELHYRLNMLGFIPVGEAVIYKEIPEEYDGRKMYHLNASAFTYNVFSGFFSGKAEVDSFVDTTSLNPVVFRQKLFVKNKYDITKEVFYDQSLGVMTIAGVKRIIPPGTKDPLSVLLYLRRMDPQGLKEFDININTNQKTYSLKGGGEINSKSINEKPYQLIKLKADIRRRDKNPYHRSSLSMLLVRVSENIPVKIDVFSGGFFLEAVLMDIR
ncbi:MAG: DUF3108 domain-containing protein [Candidatus Omnitrophica bacterium]|nr:DUF3108 domain-containing protein [Candidatus Omnitrophota bacterium]